MEVGTLFQYEALDLIFREEQDQAFLDELFQSAERDYLERQREEDDETKNRL